MKEIDLIIRNSKY